MALARFQLAAQAPAEAATHIDRLLAGDDRHTLLTAVAEQWGVRNPQAAIAWANNLSDADKTLALFCLIGGWARENPSQASEYTSAPAQST